MLKDALIKTFILIKPNFTKSFIFYVNWSGWGAGALLSQKEGIIEIAMAYASKGLSLIQCKFHPIEDECYALIWGIKHFQ